jgi:hypothetical protein
MIEARGTHPAFSPYAAQEVPDAPPGLFQIVRKSADGKKVVCATNVTANSLPFSLPAEENWKPLAGFPEASANNTVQLPPYGVAWFKAS